MTVPSVPPRAAYVHVPFCARRCGYCNFTLVAGRDDLIGDYLQALAQELQTLREPRPVETLFLGGGTPSHLPADDLEHLLALVRRWFPLLPGGEFSIEANPLDIDEPRAAVLQAAGVTRVSLGVQSFRDEQLVLLERDHRRDDVWQAIARLRPRVHSLAIDLIFAAPGETLDQWRDDLAAAGQAPVDHVSTYGLTFERGTSFWSRLRRQELRPLDDELQCQFFAAAIDDLESFGFEHYEVSNHARPGHRCRHNEVYWNAEEYYAAGPGAARYLDGRREVNHRSVTTWLRRIQAGASPVAESETLSPEDRAREALVLALRRMRGIDRPTFAARWGHSIEALIGPALARHVSAGYFADDGHTLRLTRAGLYVSDTLWGDFLRV